MNNLINNREKSKRECNILNRLKEAILDFEIYNDPAGNNITTDISYSNGNTTLHITYEDLGHKYLISVAEVE